MRALWMLPLLALQQGAGQEPAAVEPTRPPQEECPQHDGPPGPRLAIRGLAGFRYVSMIDFGTDRNQLTAEYVFPDRVRWHFEGPPPDASHLYFYRLGSELHQMQSGQPSQPIKGVSHDVVLLQLELRRAALLWPDGVDWEPAVDGVSRAPVRAHAGCRRAPIGFLEASSFSGEQPVRFTARDSDGKELEALEVLERCERDGRSWPARLALITHGNRFEETLETLDTRIHFVDLSFLPPDRRPLGRGAAPGSPIVSSDLVPVTFRSRSLPAGLEWEAALAQARAWIEEARQQADLAGQEIDPVPTFELSPEGRPVRCLIRLARVARPPPEQYRTLEERPGLLMALDGLEALDAALLELRRSVPVRTGTGAPYLRYRKGSPSPVELVLPLEEP